MTRDDLEKLILANIRRRFSEGRTAPSSKALYAAAGCAKNKCAEADVDDALTAMIRAGTVRITDGLWFEVGVKNLDEKERQLVARRQEKARMGLLPTKKVDNRKPTKVPRGMKLSAQARTLSLEGVK